MSRHKNRRFFQRLKKLNSGWVLFLIMLPAAVLGIYIIATTVLTAQDGVRYINNARLFGNSFTQALKQNWPGYPFLIFTLHSFISLFSKADSIYSWIYCGQAVSLLSRVLSLIPLYFIGKRLVGQRNSLWALFILVLLPYPAEFGSDILRDWPHILLLATGTAFLIYGARKGIWWMFALAGLAAFLGHTIRPEGAQVVIYGMLWLSICLITPRKETGRIKAIFLMLILLAGFAIPAVPFMKIRSNSGRLIPKKLKHITNQISSNTDSHTENEFTNSRDNNQIIYCAEGISTKTAKAAGRLIQAVSENLMYFFMLPFIVGLYSGFRNIRKAFFDERFFILSLLALYTVMMVLLHINYGYISRRHCLPMVVFGIFYVPLGLELIAGWAEVNIFRNKSAKPKDIQRVFSILLCIGIIICMGKIGRITPLRSEKQNYTQAANWLRENTKSNDKIVVFDSRIGLYSERKYRIIQPSDKFPESIDYSVRLLNKEFTIPNGWTVKKKFTASGENVVIYKRQINTESN